MLLHKLDANTAKTEFLKNENYCSIQLPDYIDFTAILTEIDTHLSRQKNDPIEQGNPGNFYDVNYIIYANKNGKLSWRPLEIIHPVIYVSLVSKITEQKNWRIIQEHFNKQERSFIERCSGPFQRRTNKTQTATEILNHWENFEQRSLNLSLDFSVLHHTDITNFYASIYTHSIAWALHGKRTAKQEKNNKDLLGNKIDQLLRSGRNNETMGIPQGSMLMDFIAELILAYIDKKISCSLKREKISPEKFYILRFRDDYRIFTNDTVLAEKILQIINKTLQSFRLSLGSSKTVRSSDVITGSIKPDKIAAINLNDLGTTKAKTLQKQLLRIHDFSKKYPNSGQIIVLLKDLADKIEAQKLPPLEYDKEICLAITTEILFHSPKSFPMASRLISLILNKIEKSPADAQKNIWDRIQKKISSMPNTNVINLFMQRIAFSTNLTAPNDGEKLCEVISKQTEVFFEKKLKKSTLNSIWNSEWIKEKKLKKILKETSILSKNPREMPPIITKKEVDNFEIYSL